MIESAEQMPRLTLEGIVSGLLSVGVGLQDLPDCERREENGDDEYEGVAPTPGRARLRTYSVWWYTCPHRLRVIQRLCGGCRYG